MHLTPDNTVSSVEKHLLIFLFVLFGAAVCLGGAESAAVCACLAVLSFFGVAGFAFRQKRLVLPLGLSGLSLFVLTAGYFFTILYAADRGTALVGAVKFCLPTLFMLLLVFCPAAFREKLLAVVPIVGVALTVVGAPTRLIEPLSDLFWQNGRFHGGFVYANSFAFFLLCGLVIVSFYAENAKKYLLPSIFSAVLLLGLLLTGSRSVFALTALYVVFALIFLKTARRFLPPLFAVGALLAALLSGGEGGIARLWTAFSNSATLTERFLYARDLLPVILRHPFGTGFKGYQYLQSEFQTTYYSATYVHNDWLQIMIDIGWIPALLFAAAWVKNIVKKGQTPMRRVLLTLMGAHMCVDFDLQFFGLFFLAILCFDFQGERQFVAENKKMRTVAAASCCLLGLLCLPLGAALSLEETGHYDSALKLYPYLTDSQLIELRTTQDSARARQLAESLVKRNPHLALPYDALALLDASEGRYADAVEKKETALTIAKWNDAEYVDYFNLLRRSYEQSRINGDPASAMRYRDKMKALPEKIERVLAQLSPYAEAIGNVPELELPAYITEYIAELS